MKTPFTLKLFRPEGELSAYIQAVWSASLSSKVESSVSRWLNSDACSGVLFNLGAGSIYLNEAELRTGVVLLPVSKQAQTMTLSPGSELVGIRFHPAIGYGVSGKLYEQPTDINIEEELSLKLQLLCHQLMSTQQHYARITLLYRWLKQAIDFSDIMPATLGQALKAVENQISPGQLSGEIALGQRQLERLFQTWMGLTPKHYQRILRVKNTFDLLKRNPHTKLVDLALKCGFTDQAHMTRECRKIAKMTPGKYSRRLVLER